MIRKAITLSQVDIISELTAKDLSVNRGSDSTNVANKAN